MPTPEEIVRYHMVEEEKATKLHDRKQLAELTVLWTQLQTEAPLALARLKKEGYPDATLATVVNAPRKSYRKRQRATLTTNRLGHTSLALELAVWRVGSRTYPVTDRESQAVSAEEVFLLGSDGLLYIKREGVAYPSLATLDDLLGHRRVPEEPKYDNEFVQKLVIATRALGH